MSFDKDKVVAGEICSSDLSRIREAVCVQVEKIYDSCREKDCIEDAKVLFKDTKCIRYIINNAINVKCRKAEVIDVYSDIEAVPFKRGFFTVDVKFFILVTLDFFLPNGTGPAGTRIVTKKGLVVFDKKVILFGSEGNIKIFKSYFEQHCNELSTKSRLQQDNLPVAKVEVAEPICLNAKIQDLLDKLFEDCCCADNLNRDVADLLDDNDADLAGLTDVNEELNSQGGIPRRRVVVTIGLFSIIKLVRLVQLLIPAFDFCVPNKECIAATDENPCDLFDTIDFPVDEFFPPQKMDFPGAVDTEKKMRDELQ